MTDIDRDSLTELIDLLEDENNSDLRDNLIRALFPGGLKVYVTDGQDSFYRSDETISCRVEVELGPLNDYDNSRLN